MDEKLLAMTELAPFRGLRRKEIVEWARRLDATCVALGRSVRISAAGPRWMYMVLAGSCLVTRDGRAHTILRPGDCGVPGREPVTSSLVALTPMTVLSITRAAARVLDLLWVAGASEPADFVKAWAHGGDQIAARQLLPRTDRNILPEYEDATGGLSYRG